MDRYVEQGRNSGYCFAKAISLALFRMLDLAANGIAILEEVLNASSDLICFISDAC